MEAENFFMECLSIDNFEHTWKLSQKLELEVSSFFPIMPQWDSIIRKCSPILWILKASKGVWYSKLYTSIWVFWKPFLFWIVPNFEQVAFFMQFIITLFPNWLIEPLMPFLDVTGINVCLNKAEYLELGFFFPLKNAMSMLSATHLLQISYFSQQRFVTMWHAVHFLIAYQDYLEDILLQLGVSNHLPQKIQNALSGTWWNRVDLFRR